jgi:hypothetical protein
MPRPVIAALAVALLVPAVFGPAVLAPAVSRADTTSASLHVSLRPNRPGALAVLKLTVRYDDPHAEVPMPVRHAVLRLPRGLEMEIPKLRSCSSATLRARGPRGCPGPSRLGSGRATIAVHAGSQTLTEQVMLTAFLGPLEAQPTFELFAEGLTPFQRRVVIKGTAVPDSGRYGEDLDIAVPPIATLPLEPDASIVSLSLSLGSRPNRRARQINAVIVPAHCPPGGLSFAVQSSFADGSSSTAVASVPCP